jgi:YbgC/YbaW family acyl-CoA thioester hydrolase
MDHECGLTVRSYECDSYGHVNHATYLHYLEFARHEYLSDNGISMPDLRASGNALLVARIDIRYRRPAYADEKLSIRTRPLRKTRIGGVLDQAVLRSGDVIAQAEVTWVCVDARGRPARLPSAFDREGLNP